MITLELAGLRTSPAALHAVVALLSNTMPTLSLLHSLMLLLEKKVYVLYWIGESLLHGGWLEKPASSRIIIARLKLTIDGSKDLMKLL